MMNAVVKLTVRKVFVDIYAASVARHADVASYLYKTIDTRLWQHDDGF